MHAGEVVGERGSKINNNRVSGGGESVGSLDRVIKKCEVSRSKRPRPRDGVCKRQSKKKVREVVSKIPAAREMSSRPSRTTTIRVLNFTSAQTQITFPPNAKSIINQNNHRRRHHQSQCTPFLFVSRQEQQPTGGSHHFPSPTQPCCGDLHATPSGATQGIDPAPAPSEQLIFLRLRSKAESDLWRTTGCDWAATTTKGL